MGFVCSVEHIKQLAMYAIRNNDGRFSLVNKYGNGDYFDAMNNIANILHKQNMEAAGRLSDIKEILITEEDTIEVLDPVWILKMCDHYELYTLDGSWSEWFTSEAHYIIYCIRRMAIERIPGYFDLPYEYKKRKQTTRKRRQL